MYKERLVALQQRTGFFDSATGIQQFAPFVADVDICAEIIMSAEEIYNLFTKVVDIYGDVIESGIFQPEDDTF